jgi:hypothetical protein
MRQCVLVIVWSQVFDGKNIIRVKCLRLKISFYVSLVCSLFVMTVECK